MHDPTASSGSSFSPETLATSAACDAQMTVAAGPDKTSLHSDGTDEMGSNSSIYRDGLDTTATDASFHSKSDYSIPESPSAADERTSDPSRQHDHPHDPQEQPSRKRKTDDRQGHGESKQDDKPEAETTADRSKKVKLDSITGTPAPAVKRPLPLDRSLLPAEIWHYIFTFCPPKTLGNLMGVNKLFHSYLDPSSCIPSKSQESPTTLGPAAVLKPDSLWKASRRAFWPCMPAPLKSMSELDMWKLACSSACHHCGKRAGDAAHATTESSPGPGMDRVAVVWPFATRTCGPCLVKNSVKEIDLLLSSSTPSALMVAIPFVLLTDRLDAYSFSMAERGQLPKEAQYTKLFWKECVDRLKEEFFEVKALGMATTEEWLKGLERRGVELQQDSSRWENYAISGGIDRLRSKLYIGYEPESVQTLSTSMPNQTHISRSFSSQPTVTSVASSGLASLPPRTNIGSKHERTREEVAELKAARRVEIERRAALLDPPMQPSLLVHIPSFQAATQIITPLDDSSWELLKPRLLAQRADAEQREREAALQATLQQELAERRRAADANKDDEASDSDWDELQGPLRARISRYADEFIEKNWDDGDKVSKDMCGEFAASVLLHVRKQFYADVAKDAAAARALGKEPTVDPPKGPFTQKLTLENMKWIFDVKIRPHTESLRKELFLCNGCDANFKYYGFEGVVQHYAAKHTGALSLGSIVVYWRAEWPEIPPFRPNPRAARQSYNQAQAQIAQQQKNGQMRHGYPTYQTPLPSVPPQHGPAYPVPPAAAPYVAPLYPEPYQGGAPGPSYVLPSFGPGQQVYGPPAYQAPPGPYHAQYPGPPVPAPVYTPSGYGPAPPSIAPPQPAPQPPAGGYSHGHGAYQNNPGYVYGGGQPGPDRYRVQLEEMAKLSRELWNSTSSVKDLPGSARLQAIIYHMAKRFHAKFNEPAPLTMFIDGLSGNKDMRPVRNVNGLLCKLCHTGYVNPPPTEQDRKSFSMPQLVNHFQSRHVEPAIATGQHTPVPEWTSDMILLPDLAGMQALRRSASSDKQKEKLLGESLPQIFEATAPHSNNSHPPRESRWLNAPETHNSLQDASLDRRGKLYDSTSLADDSRATNGHANGNKFGAIGDGAPKSSHGTQLQQGQDGRNKKKKHGSKGHNCSGTYRPADDWVARANPGGAKAYDSIYGDEDSHRQGDEVRAMWVADREQSVSRERPAQIGPELENGTIKPHGQLRQSMSLSRPSLPSKPPTQGLIPSPSFRQQHQPPAPPAHQAPNAFEREGSDPLAALELYLDQERNRAAANMSQQPATKSYGDDPRRDSDTYTGPQTQYRRYSSGRADERRRSRSPGPRFIRYADEAPPEHYRERSPPPPHGEPPYGHRASLSQDLPPYDRVPPMASREYYGIHEEERRSRPPVEYETYELIRARDAQGEYYIRRPVIRRGLEPDLYHAGSNARPPAAERRVYRESSYPAYDRLAGANYHPSVSRQSAHSIYDSRGPAPFVRQEPASHPRPDTGFAEEYDPRYPSAPPPPIGSGRPRYM
ncbi:uncharacterized protein PpBr36_05943 [Pyricularia pennisetigena]|uniref:uncharacterized protein n=1 Tax=Pyricularia pennisetigena TaxID=1578925 RepID=UPI00114EEA0C|nr:uncharacterized protein PpBr36_05943 [Pyricularia pennisetigena]TLS22720.1 hypothetical protein PpBr36_05943 [Pyricularia pennisetigena]